MVGRGILTCYMTSSRKWSVANCPYFSSGDEGSDIISLVRYSGNAGTEMSGTNAWAAMTRVCHTHELEQLSKEKEKITSVSQNDNLTAKQRKGIHLHFNSALLNTRDAWFFFTSKTSTSCHTYPLTLWASTETQNCVRPHVSTFLSKYWRYCFDKHTNGKICSWRSSLWKLHSESISFGKGMTLWVRAGASGALLEKSWSFLVPEEATKPILFRVWLLSSLMPFHASSRNRYVWRWT